MPLGDMSNQSLSIMDNSIIRVKLSKFSNESLNGGENRVYQEVEVASSKEVLHLSDKIKGNHNFTVENQVISTEECLSKYVPLFFLDYFLDYETIIYNEIFHTYSNKRPIYIKNLGNLGIVEWNNEDIIQQFILEKKPFLDSFYKMLVILKILIGMFILSNMVSLIARVIYVSSPILSTLLIRKIVPQPHQQRLLSMLNGNNHAWYEIYTQDNESFRKFDLASLFSFVLLTFFFYLLFIPCSIICFTILFPDNTPTLLPTIFFILLTIAENFSFIFLRTRTSIKFFPPAINLVIFSFLAYLNCNVYPFFILALYLLIHASTILITGTLLFIEYPSRTWTHLRPSFHSPRMMYLPVFSLSWMKELPHLWTMFFPLYGRSKFTESMLSLVDNTFGRHEFNNLDEYNLRNRNMYTYDTLYLLRNSDSGGLTNVNQELQSISLGSSDFDDF